MKKVASMKIISRLVFNTLYVLYIYQELYDSTSSLSYLLASIVPYTHFIGQ